MNIFPLPDADMYSYLIAHETSLTEGSIFCVSDYHLSRFIAVHVHGLWPPHGQSSQSSLCSVALRVGPSQEVDARRSSMLTSFLLCSLIAEAATLSFAALGAHRSPTLRLPLAHRGVSMGLVRQVRLLLLLRVDQSMCTQRPADI